jgi:hypothetical protein
MSSSDEILDTSILALQDFFRHHPGLCKDSHYANALPGSPLTRAGTGNQRKERWTSRPTVALSAIGD